MTDNGMIERSGMMVEGGHCELRSFVWRGNPEFLCRGESKKRSPRMAKYAMLAMTRKRHPHPNPLPSRARENMESLLKRMRGSEIATSIASRDDR